MIKTYGVHDHWTDIAKKNDVDIMSVDGVITGIKVNGEDYGGGGSSDFSTAVVTVTGKPTFFAAEVASLTENGLKGTCRKSPSENSFTVVLYQGSTIMQGVKGITPSFSIPADETNIILDESNGWYLITGDCTITIS